MKKLEDGHRLSELSNDLFEILHHGTMYTKDIIVMNCDQCACSFKATPGYYKIHRKYIEWFGDYKYTYEATCPECGSTVVEVEED